MLCAFVFLCAVLNVSEDSLQGPFSFRSVGLRDQTQVTGFGSERARLLKHLTFCCLLLSWLYIKQVFEV